MEAGQGKVLTREGLEFLCKAKSLEASFGRELDMAMGRGDALIGVAVLFLVRSFSDSELASLIMEARRMRDGSAKDR